MLWCFKRGSQRVSAVSEILPLFIVPNRYGKALLPARFAALAMKRVAAQRAFSQDTLNPGIEPISHGGVPARTASRKDRLLAKRVSRHCHIAERGRLRRQGIAWRWSIASLYPCDRARTQLPRVIAMISAHPDVQAMMPATESPELVLRPARQADAEACGLICYQAFKTIAEQHRFPPDFPTPDAAVGLLSDLFSRKDIYAVVAELEGQAVGSNALRRCQERIS